MKTPALWEDTWRKKDQFENLPRYHPHLVLPASPRHLLSLPQHPGQAHALPRPWLTAVVVSASEPLLAEQFHPRLMVYRHVNV